MPKGTYKQAETLFLNSIENTQDVRYALQKVKRRYGSKLANEVRKTVKEYRDFFSHRQK